MSKTLLFAAAALALQIAVVRAADPPEVQEGLWEVHSLNTQNPGNKTTEVTYRLCRSHAYDKAMYEAVKNVKGCATEFESLGGGRFSSSSRCTIAGTFIVSKGTYTHESPTSTRSEAFATYVPPMQGVTDETRTQDLKYVGACPAGLNPGDRIMADGSVQRYRK
jgi:hypothetical protein